MIKFSPFNIKPKDWSHEAHVFSCAFFCFREKTFFKALVSMRCFIIHFGADRGFTSEACSAKYHETITSFWVEMIHQLIEKESIDNLDDFSIFYESNKNLFGKKSGSRCVSRICLKVR